MDIIQQITAADKTLNIQEHQRLLYQAPSLYGEIDLRSFAGLINHVPLGGQDAFADLGSGTGKPTLYIHLVIPGILSLGYEWDTQRCQYANQLKTALGIKATLFFQADFLKSDLEHITCVYVDLTAFSIPQIIALSKKLDLLPNLHTVISLRPLIQFQKLPFCLRERVCCSWDFQMAYLYSALDLTN